MINIIKLQEFIGKYKIVLIQETGSSLFSDSPKDEDYVVVIENWDKDYALFNYENCDYFCHSFSLFEKKCKLEAGSFLDIYAITYQLGRILYGNKPIIDYDWLKNNKKAIKITLEYGEKSFFSPFTICRNSLGELVCSKTMCWGLITYFIVQNKGYFLTESQKKLLQSCHNKQLPRSYADSLKQNLLDLLNES